MPLRRRRIFGPAPAGAAGLAAAGASVGAVGLLSAGLLSAGCGRGRGRRAAAGRHQCPGPRAGQAKHAKAKHMSPR
jgi:hypothetical protein